MCDCDNCDCDSIDKCNGKGKTGYCDCCDHSGLVAPD